MALLGFYSQDTFPDFKKAAVFALALLALEFFYQFFAFTPGNLGLSLLRAFAFSGATLISLAVFVGPLAYLVPRLNFVPYRRYLGVSGFVFLIGHVLSVFNLIFHWSLVSAYYSLNPFLPKQPSCEKRSDL